MRNERFRIEILRSDHQRDHFTSGIVALDRYIREQAGQEMRRRVAVSYLLIEQSSGAVAGYYTLSSAGVDYSALPADFARRLPRYPQQPATLIGRLAVDVRYRGQGLGRGLLLDSLTRSFHLSRQIGALAVIVDAKDDEARRFYEHFGFRGLVDKANRLFIEMATVAALNLPPPSSL